MGKKKYTIEFFGEEFKKENYRLLSTVYTGWDGELKYICPNGHKHQTSFGSWLRHKRCPYCYGNVKKTIEMIKLQFETEGYILITTKYKNSKQKLKYICSEGHEHSISWSNWRRGVRCPYCSGKNRKSIPFIKQQFVKEGYKLLSTKYKNDETKLNYICSEGHNGYTTWSSWVQGSRCAQCAGNIRKTIEYVKVLFKLDDVVVLDNEYVNCKTKLRCRCKYEHEFKTSLDNWENKGHRCPTCAIINNRGSGNPNWKGGISCEPYCQDWTKDLKELIKQRDGYKCLNPDCWGADKRLDIHHIDYNKKSCGPENLITVCRSCNARANFNREWHESWYKAILYKRYGYTY